MIRLLFLFIPLLCFACQNPAPVESRADKLAKSVCGCTEELLRLNKQAETDRDSLAFRNIANAFEKARTCVHSIGIKPEERESLNRSLDVLCPDLAAHKDILPELWGE